MLTRWLAVVSRLRFVARRRRLSDDVAAELNAHADMLAERYLASGMSPEEAMQAAKRQLGNTTLVREDVYRMNSVAWLETIAADVRYALRTLTRDSGFSVVAIATLALGIGANAAIVSVVHSVLVKPLPYAAPDELYSAQIVIPERRDQIPSLPATVQAFLEWRRATTSFSGVAALRPWECNLSGGNEPERVGGARVSANFFNLLGVAPALGRGFLPDEEQPGKEKVIVISDALWRRRYGADPQLVGKTITINGTSHLVAGVAPASLIVPTGTMLHTLLPFGPQVHVWKPIAPTARELENESWDHGVMVRLPAGVGPDAGRHQLEAALVAMIRAQAPDARIAPVVELVPVREIYAGRIRLRLLLVLAASALLLVTACVSLANLLLARAASHGNEFATRIALGASCLRILSLTFAHTLVLTVIAGAVGIALAVYGADALARYGPDDVRSLTTTRQTLPLVACAFAISLLTGIICGAFPAWQAYRSNALTELQDGGRTSSGGAHAVRSRSVLVGVEMCLATALLASAALLLHSFVNVMTAERGYQVERILTTDLSPSGQRYADAARRVAFYGELVDRVRALPGVLSAGAISELPAVRAESGASRTIFYTADTDARSLMLARPVAMIRGVTTGYFAASGTGLRAGRLLTDDERVDVAVISESLARRLWPGEPAHAVIGRQFRQGDVKAPAVTITGVVEDARPGGVDREPPPVIYRPYPQWASGPMTLLVRTAVEPSSLAPGVRSVIRAMDADLPLVALRTMREVVASTVAERRFQMTLTAIFGLVALALGAVGLYGVVSYSVSRRTREIGLRLALGARRADVMRSVFSQGMPPVVAGLAVGLAGAIAVARTLRGLLYGIAPTDPLALGVVVVVLLVASALACFIPARRAATLDPLVALRHQ